MKKHLTAYVLLLLSIKTFSQVDYTPFPTENAYWSEQWLSYEYNGPYGEMSADIYNTKVFFPHQDTTINSQTYTKIYISNDTILDLSDPETYVYGLMYQEGKLVEIYRKNNVNGFGLSVIYNFEAVVGDTLYAYEDVLGAYRYYILDNIEAFEMLDGSFRNKFNYVTHSFHVDLNNDTSFSTPSYSMYHIEGIGSNYHLFRDHAPPESQGDSHWLRCFHENGQNIWRKTTNSQCFYNDTIYLNPVRELEVLDKEISIIPNPTSRLTQVYFKGEMNERFEFRLFDSQGKLLKEGSAFGEDGFELDMRRYLSGVYFLQVLEAGVVVGMERVLKM